MKKILLPLHIIVAVAIIIIAQICGNVVNNILPINTAIDNLIFSIVYIFVTFLSGILYSKYVLHFNYDEIGLSFKLPELKWILLAIFLPISITAFYLIFVDGKIVKGNTENIIHIIIKAIFTAGIAAGTCEEFIFRGLIMNTFERAWGKISAAIVPSVLFAAMHITGDMTVIDMLLLFIAGTSVGVMFSLIAIESGSIWSGALIHTLWNITIIGNIFVIKAPEYNLSDSFIYKYELVSNSLLLTGGRFGIESALPPVIVYCLISVVILILLKKQKK